MCKRLKKISQSTLRRKVIKNIKPLQKKIRMSPQNNGYSKNLCILKKTLRLCALCVRFYINYSVTCLFDATMPEKYLG